ncbi:hypothetical protein NE848_16715 [Gramella jeungdoensis]|uniref:Uncharacterized protein n=1 Tax=Gramella jeungdoensis TaxID=708091 RepID=A0ABT0Z5P0_9FLAO|nr:hypothetical protein [Gramella jeungdoensis]MCM8571043.1 hypothetical protein [Gramella jeungdoensis]
MKVAIPINGSGKSCLFDLKYAKRKNNSEAEKKTRTNCSFKEKLKAKKIPAMRYRERRRKIN